MLHQNELALVGAGRTNNPSFPFSDSPDPEHTVPRVDWNVSDQEQGQCVQLLDDYLRNYTALSTFYNSDSVLKRKMDLSNALQSEWDLALQEILKMIDGLPHKKNSNDNIYIGIGDGRVCGAGAPFARYIIHRLQSLGYNNIFLVDESYTSQYCPYCGTHLEAPMDNTHKRKFECTSNNCRNPVTDANLYLHRDKMAAINIAHRLEQYLTDGSRPDYLPTVPHKEDWYTNP